MRTELVPETKTPAHPEDADVVFETKTPAHPEDGDRDSVRNHNTSTS